MMALHSDGERMEVRRNAPGTFGTSCLAAGVKGGVQTNGEEEVAGWSGMAFGEEAWTIAGWRFGGRRSGPGVLEQTRNRDRI